MNYKGYIGSVTYDDEAGILYGKVTNCDDIITFHGESVAEIRRAFRESVDAYLEFCAEEGDEPAQRTVA